MRLTLRALFLVLLIVVLAVVTGGVAVRVMLTREDMEALVASQLREVLQRPVQIADINVLLLQGIRIRGLRVLEAPGFPGREFLGSEIVIAKYRWAALLQRRLEFSEVRLVSPRIRLVRRADGEWNVEGLIRPRPAERPQRHAALPVPVSLAADVLAIEDGEITIQDIPRNRLHQVRGVHLEVRDFATDKPFAFKAGLTTDSRIGDRDVTVETSAKGRLDLASFDWPKAWLEAESLRLSVGGETLTASGRVRGFAAPNVDVRLRVPRLTSEFLSRYHDVPPGISLPPALARVRVQFPQRGQARLESLDLAAEPLKLRASGTMKLGEEGSYRLTLTVPQAPLERVAALWAGLAQRRLVGVGEGTITLAGKPGGADLPAVERVSLRLRGFSGVLFGDKQVSGADIQLSGSDNFRELDLRASRGRVVAYGNAFSGLDLALRLQAGDLDVDRLDVTWSVSRFKLKGRIQNVQAPKSVYVEGSIDRLQLQEAINATAAIVQQVKAAKPAAPRPEGERKWSQVFKYAIPKSFPATSGKLRVADLTHPHFHTANVDVLWELRGISTGLDNVNGSVRTGFGPGRVSSIPELEKGNRILKVIFLPFVYMHKLNNMGVAALSTAYPKTLDFTRIYGEFGLQAGVVDIRVFHVDSPQLVAFADGKVDFPKERVGLHVLTRLTTSRAPLPQYLSDEKGRPSIGFFVKDDLNKPTLEIDLRKMSATAIEDALQGGLQRGQVLFGPK
ncbi:MAG: AsmA family protein [Elusimicrobia bacterium]|nr:AsmA family protein [Elusimicrobiota bacterium]